MVTTLLRPTLHVEVELKSRQKTAVAAKICDEVAQSLRSNYASLQIGQPVAGFGNDEVQHASRINQITIADYTGPWDLNCHHDLDQVQLDVQTYTLNEHVIPQVSSPGGEDETPRLRLLELPNVALKDEWDSLIYDEALPSQLLRYLTRMLGIMKQPGLNLSTFNWNRLCLLHGPPGSGKSTLCRALAQKLSIRLSKAFPDAALVEVNTNSMLSKYFGESGKLISALFEQIHGLAQVPSTLVCVVMDEVETIAGSRDRVVTGGECSDGMRATNQLLTGLDRLRSLPNVIVLCTSNLLNAIDPAFLDRVDIKQLIPSPSPEAIYNIFRSCLNELVRSNILDMAAIDVSSKSSSAGKSSSPMRSSASSNKRTATRTTKDPASSPQDRVATTSSKRRAVARSDADKPASSSPEKSSSLPENSSSSPEKWAYITVPTIPTFQEMRILFHGQPESIAQRVWALAQKCEGFSGRTLRRLPMMGLTMYTWGGSCSLEDAVSALEAAVNQELKAKQKKADE